MKSGWFKMYRSIIDWEWFKEHDMTCFLLYCLSKANISERVWRGTLIKPGQVVISRSIVCDELGIKDRRYRTIVNRLVKSGEITIAPSQKHTIVTIVNWDRYQADYVEEAETISPTSDQRATNERPTSNIEKSEIKPSQSAENGKVNKESKSVKDQDDKIGKEKNLDLLFDDEIPVQSPPPKAEKKSFKSDKEEKVDCDFIAKLYNERCPHLPRVIKLSDKRKIKIKLRFAEMDHSYETLQMVFDKANASDFIRGINKSNWRGDFSWIFDNSDNWIKILEGKYDNDRFKSKPLNEQNDESRNSTLHTTQGRYISPAERNATTSARQKCDVLNTLAECQREFEVGNL